ncbi:MAG TPA: hypothetical protein VFQ38_04185 [Longimicrobiales bacterium]|nr:hypothetical protein [Longimicrobiales bacterium]
MPTTAAALELANLYFESDLRPIVDSLDRPVLFVFSSAPWTMAAAEEGRERWPGVPVQAIDGTAHALFRDRPEEFNRVLEAFLASPPEAPAAAANSTGAAASTSPATPW